MGGGKRGPALHGRRRHHPRVRPGRHPPPPRAQWCSPAPSSPTVRIARPLGNASFKKTLPSPAFSVLGRPRFFCHPIPLVCPVPLGPHIGVTLLSPPYTRICSRGDRRIPLKMVRTEITYIFTYIYIIYIFIIYTLLSTHYTSISALRDVPPGETGENPSQPQRTECATYFSLFIDFCDRTKGLTQRSCQASRFFEHRRLDHSSPRVGLVTKPPYFFQNRQHLEVLPTLFALKIIFLVQQRCIWFSSSCASFFLSFE